MSDLGNRQVMSRNIQKYMNATGKTRRDVAAGTKIPYSTLCEWINCNKYPRIDNIQRLAEFFGIDKSDLIESEYSQPIPGAFDVPATKRIPLLGRIAAGLPLYAEENIEGYIWTDKNHGAEYFGLRVAGDSMNAAGIKDGDIVVVRKQEELQPNEIGVILVDDGATIKRMQRKGSLVILNPQSTNPENTPQMYDLKEHTIKVIGKVVESRTEYI